MSIITNLELQNKFNTAFEKSLNQKLTIETEIKEVLDVDFVNKIFYTTDVKISFDNTDKRAGP